MDNYKLLEHMSFDSLTHLRNYHPAWRLMAADNAPFIMSFLYAEFISQNNREIPEYILINHLEVYMETIPTLKDNNKTARDYLTQWADDSYGWLRKFYPIDSDEVHYDLTSTAVTAINWLVGLKRESFIGTESRLILVFELFHQIIEQSQTDPKIKIQELEKRKAELENEIEEAKKGNIRVLEPIQIKERFMQAVNLSNEILSDFRAVEQNFRDLNRNMREKIANWDKSKGELLSNYFSDQNAIYQSDQGRSFKAFFEFLMSNSAQRELEETINTMKAISPIKDMVNYSGINNIANDWLDGSRHVWSVVELMSEQLKRYVDDSYVEEEHRINEVIKEIEKKAMNLNQNKRKFISMDIDTAVADINLLFDRTLFTPPQKVKFNDTDIDYGEQTDSDEELYSHISIDKQKLIEQISYFLSTSKKVTLMEILNKYPLKYGLSELLTYLTLEQSNFKCNVDETSFQRIYWNNENNDIVKADLPTITFYKKED